MKQTIESKNKELVLEAFDTLFNKRNRSETVRRCQQRRIYESR